MKGLTIGNVLLASILLSACINKNSDKFLGNWVVDNPVNSPKELKIIEKSGQEIRVIQAFVNKKKIVFTDTFSTIYDKENDKLIVHILTKAGCLWSDFDRDIYFEKNSNKLVFKDEATFKKIDDVDAYFKINVGNNKK